MPQLLVRLRLVGETDLGAASPKDSTFPIWSKTLILPEVCGGIANPDPYGNAKHEEERKTDPKQLTNAYYIETSSSIERRKKKE
jgi:hypothetical protein